MGERDRLPRFDIEAGSIQGGEMRAHNVAELTSALRIKRTLGVRVAARYMQKRGWSIEAALWTLCGSTR